MTKAELINEIKNRIGFDTDNETYAMSKDERDFYTSILNILEQEPIYYPPCQDCHTKMNEIVRAYDNVKFLDDAVSRQVVKEQMLKYGFHAPDMTATEFVEDLPSVLPKRERR